MLSFQGNGLFFQATGKSTMTTRGLSPPELCPLPLHFFLGASITGAPGPAGLPGPKGEKGIPGIVIGDPGKQGSKGKKGDQGMLAQVRPCRN